MPPPIDPDKRAAILQAIKDGQLSCRAIARHHNTSPSTVSKIAADEGVDDAFGRAHTKRATEARTVDLAAERTRLAGLLMQDAFRLRERMWEQQQQIVVVGGKEAYAEIMDVPASAGDFRNYLTAIGIAVDKIGVLTRDETQGLAAVDSWLRSLGVGATS